jgi:hypothetical protein
VIQDDLVHDLAGDLLAARGRGAADGQASGLLDHVGERGHAAEGSLVEVAPVVAGQAARLVVV